MLDVALRAGAPGANGVSEVKPGSVQPGLDDSSDHRSCLRALRASL